MTFNGDSISLQLQMIQYKNRSNKDMNHNACSVKDVDKSVDIVLRQHFAITYD